MSAAPPRTRTLGQHLADAAMRLGLVVLRQMARLPYARIRSIGDAIGSIGWVVSRRRRDITLTNLRLCFPDMSEKQRETIGRQHFQYFVRSLLDRFAFWFGDEARLREWVWFEDWEIFQAHEGRPMILLAPHFCGMDAAGMRLSMDRALAAMYARQKNARFNQVMIEGRQRFGGHHPGAKLFLRTDGLRPVLRTLRAGVPFYFLPDMDLGARDAVFVPFFGVQAATVTSVTRLARATGAVVIPLVTTMTDTGYACRFHPPWEDDPGESLEEAALRMNRFIEQRVLEMTPQYLWSHRRFKTRPPGEPGLYRNRG